MKVIRFIFANKKAQRTRWWKQFNFHYSFLRHFTSLNFINSTYTIITNNKKSEIEMAQKGMNSSSNKKREKYDYLCTSFNCRLLMSPKKPTIDRNNRKLSYSWLLPFKHFCLQLPFSILFLCSWLNVPNRIANKKKRRWNIAKSNIVRSVRELSEEKKEKMKKNLNGAKSNYVSARSRSQG